MYIKEIIDNVGNGCTIPLHCETTCGESVIVKTFNNLQSNIVLINELVCYEIAKLLGLPVPKSGICIINEETIDAKKFITGEVLGKGFYSQRIDHATILHSHKILDLVRNKEDIPKCVLFDHLIYNKDRNRGNLLIAMGKGQNPTLMYLIDHTHVFNKECLWDNWQLELCIQEEDYKDTDVLAGNRALYEMFFTNQKMSPQNFLDISNDFKSKLSKEKFEEIIDKVPPEWELSKVNSEALVNYLTYRLDNLDEICKVIINEYKI